MSFGSHGHANPVDVVLTGARPVGNEFCWPRAAAFDVIGALGQLDQAVLGFELWSLGTDDRPRVVAWSGYQANLDKPWAQVIEDCVAAAISELRDRADDDLWVNLTWISKRESAEQQPGETAR